MRPLLLSIALCFFIQLIDAQKTLKEAVDAFNSYAGNYPVEKLYLHLDKPYYVAGEDMFFRAYLTDIHLNQENVVSGIIYVELSDERKRIVKRTLLYSEENEFAGQFELPDSLPAANYHLRAYTNWMRNAGEDFYYHRDIYIGNASESKKVAEKQFDFQVDFFPEGGHLLQGIPNKVAFKSLGNDGFGANAFGVLKDDAGNEVLTFSSLYAGMGAFEFVPEEHTSYTAIVTYRDKEKEYKLPLAVQGTTLSVSQSEDSVYLTIKSNNPQEERLSIIGQSRHTVCYAVEGLRREAGYTITVSKEQFPTGIAQFTLLKDSYPISERLVFIDKKDDLHVTFIPDKDTYGDREKVALDIHVTDSDGQPVEGSFSLSVTDDKVFTPSFGTENIKGNLLLDADLKGFIETPGWYFSGKDPEKEEALDVLLCTQGWTRYDWSDSGNDMSNFKYPAESEFHLTGKVTNLVGKGINEGEVILFGSNNIPGIAKTGKDGRFGFYGFDCPDSTVFVLQSRTKNNKKLFIGFEIDKPDNHAELSVIPLNKVYVDEFITETSYSEDSIRQIRFDKNIWTIDLSEVSVTSRKRPETAFGTGSFRFEGEFIKRNQPVGEMLKALPSTRPATSAMTAARYALYIVDDQKISYDLWVSLYSKLPATMFESIEVLRGIDATPYGVLGDYGAYKIKTKIFNGNNIVPDASIQTYQPEGYCVRKEFYIPPYDKPEIRHSTIPDLRTTIYWNPAVNTDKDGKARLEFYTADYVQTYSYVLEGIGNNMIGCSFIKK